jgi:hypothetical protein
MLCYLFFKRKIVMLFIARRYLSFFLTEKKKERLMEQ